MRASMLRRHAGAAVGDPDLRRVADPLGHDRDLAAARPRPAGRSRAGCAGRAAEELRRRIAPAGSPRRASSTTSTLGGRRRRVALHDLAHRGREVARHPLQTRHVAVGGELRGDLPQLVDLAQDVRRCSARRPTAKCSRSRFQTSRRCSVESRIGVSGFLISWAMIRAIAAQASRRWARRTSVTSSTTNSAAGSLSPASGTQTSDQSRSLPSEPFGPPSRRVAWASSSCRAATN